MLKAKNGGYAVGKGGKPSWGLIFLKPLVTAIDRD
jgi:hypothetical protein